MDPVEGGDVRYRPLNMGTLGEKPTEGDVLAQQQPGSGIDGQAVEGGLAAAAGEPVVPATPGESVEPATPQVADVSLNGAQITGLIAILSQVPAGLITKDGAAALIAASFPSINAQQIAAILAGVNDTMPAAPAAPAPAPVARSESRAEALVVAEGQWVTLPDGRVGRVDHVMAEGTLNLGDVEMLATPDDPAALVSVWDENEFDEPLSLIHI